VAPIVEERPDVRAPMKLDDGTTAVAPEAPADELLEDDLLVEEVSIDGMCGVY
jgi:mycofactocin precursor